MMIKTLTAIGLALGLASSAYAAPPVANESFIDQVGVGNTAIVGQKHGHNDADTLQFGAHNFSLTLQDQKGKDPGNNNSLVDQIGFGNTAVTLQTAKNDLKNKSTTIQAGAFNHAFVVQK